MRSEVRRWAERALEFIEGVAAARAGGLPAAARTLALCGVAGMVAFSMIGARGGLLGLKSGQHVQYKMRHLRKRADLQG